MAEHVQAALDHMVAPLRDLMDRHIFTEQEIKTTVARRRESEYLLRRLAARKADFLRYIEAEQQLERLRQLRTVQRKRDHRQHQRNDEGNNTVTKEKQHVGDVHIVQHIHLLFVRALRKFRADLSLHLLHADFCKQQKAWTRLGRVYAEALQVFPRQAGLWIETASHEFFGPTRSIRSARILLQRGIRINQTTSEDLWMEYFSMELHYAQMLKGRRQILQAGEPEDIDDGNNDAEESSDSDYKIAQIVYNNAIKAIPESIPFRLRFLDTCRRFPNAEELIESIQKPLQKSFALHTEAWIARALYEAEKQSNSLSISKIEQSVKDEQSDNESKEDEDCDRPSKKARTKDPVVSVLEEAVETISNDDMNLQAFRFAQTYQEELRHQEKPEQQDQVEKFIQQLMESVAAVPSSPDLVLELVNYLVRRRKQKQAVAMLEDFCNNHNSVPASLWIRWAALSPNIASNILEKALHKITMDHPDHMMVLLQYFGSILNKQGHTKNQLFNTFQRILLLAAGGSELVTSEGAEDLEFGLDSVPHACLRYLEHAHKTSGLKGARKVYSAVLFQSSTIKVNESNVEYVKSFVDTCTELESEDRTRRRRVYDKALELFEDTPLENVYREKRNDRAIYQ